jgi:hypothetical protein
VSSLASYQEDDRHSPEESPQTITILRLGDASEPPLLPEIIKCPTALFPELREVSLACLLRADTPSSTTNAFQSGAAAARLLAV